MAEKINIFWFRRDLRIADNPALTHAAESGRVLAVYILDQNYQGDHGPGAASRWWLHHSLNALNESLQGQLNIFRGDPQTILQDLQQKCSASEIFWNRCYEPQSIERDAAIKKFFQDQQVEVKKLQRISALGTDAGTEKRWHPLPGFHSLLPEGLPERRCSPGTPAGPSKSQPFTIGIHGNPGITGIASQNPLGPKDGVLLGDQRSRWPAEDAGIF